MRVLSSPTEVQSNQPISILITLLKYNFLTTWICLAAAITHREIYSVKDRLYSDLSVDPYLWPPFEVKTNSTCNAFEGTLHRFYMLKFSLFVIRSTTQPQKTLALEELCQVWENNPDDLIVMSPGSQLGIGSYFLLSFFTESWHFMWIWKINVRMLDLLSCIKGNVDSSHFYPYWEYNITPHRRHQGGACGCCNNL